MPPERPPVDAVPSRELLARQVPELRRHFRDILYGPAIPNGAEKRARLMALFKLKARTGKTAGYCQLPEVPPEARMPSPAEIERAKRDWNVLIHSLDYENDEWYERNAEYEGPWQRIGFFRVHDLLFELGFGDPKRWTKSIDDDGGIKHELVPDDERNEIIKQFKARHKVTWKRGHTSTLKPVKQSETEKRERRKIGLEGERDQPGFDF